MNMTNDDLSETPIFADMATSPTWKLAMGLLVDYKAPEPPQAWHPWSAWTNAPKMPVPQEFKPQVPEEILISGDDTVQMPLPPLPVRQSKKATPRHGWFDEGETVIRLGARAAS